MEYSFLADLLTTFRSSSNFIKALIIVGFYGSFSFCFAVVFSYLARRRDKDKPAGLIGYSPMAGLRETIKAKQQQPAATNQQ